MGNHLDMIAPIAGAVLGSTILPGIGYGISALGGGAIGSGLGSAGYNYSQTHNIGSALKSGALSGAGSYVGGNLGNSLFGEGGSLGNMGTVGEAVDKGLGSGASSDLASYLGPRAGAALGSSLGSIGGSAVGGQMASSFAPQGQPKMAGNYPFVPSQAAAASVPKSFAGSASLTPMQQASGLATQGVYGGGNGAEEQAYYGNLLNRQLVDSGGNVSPLSSLSPIEQSYNQKLGFGGAKDSTNLLEMLSKWNPGSQNA